MSPGLTYEDKLTPETFFLFPNGIIFKCLVIFRTGIIFN